MQKWSASLRIESKCGKIRTRKTPNTDTFHAVVLIGERGLKEKCTYFKVRGIIHIKFSLSKKQ